MGADDHQHDAHHPGWDAESGLECGADGVGLHHAAHEAQGQGDGHGEETSQELAESALEGGGDVVHRSAVNIAILVYLAGLDGQSGLSVDGGHAEEGDDPHPEDGPRSAGEDGSGGAHDVRCHLAAMAVARAWKELMPLACFLPRRVRLPNTFRMPSPKQRT